MGKISTSPRYVIDITETYTLSLGELGVAWAVGSNSENLEKMKCFLTNG